MVSSSEGETERRRVDVRHTGVSAPSEVISRHCSLSSKVFHIKNISKTQLLGILVCFRMTTTLQCLHMFFLCTLVHIDSHLEVTRFSAALLVTPHCQCFVCRRCAVCSASACWFRCVVSLLSPFVFVISVAVSHSSTPKLLFRLPSLRPTVCLMFGPGAGFVALCL